MSKIYNHVQLSDNERDTLIRLMSKGSAPAKTILHAHILLATDETTNRDESVKLRYVYAKVKVPRSNENFPNGKHYFL